MFPDERTKRVFHDVQLFGIGEVAGGARRQRRADQPVSERMTRDHPDPVVPVESPKKGFVGGVVVKRPGNRVKLVRFPEEGGGGR
jgi:hypothetical protein